MIHDPNRPPRLTIRNIQPRPVARFVSSYGRMGYIDPALAPCHVCDETKPCLCIEADPASGTGNICRECAIAAFDK
jgi:hypothetical protein